MVKNVMPLNYILGMKSARKAKPVFVLDLCLSCFRVTATVTFTVPAVYLIYRN